LEAIFKQVSGEVVMDKREWRKQMAALSFSEKIRILEKLRDRSLAIAASGLRRPQHSVKPADNRLVSDKT
jgi:hypothetical protein